MKNNFLPFQICATCKNLQIVEQGCEIEHILDTAYVTFRCSLAGWETREYYLTIPASNAHVIEDKPFECIFWEDWKEPFVGKNKE